MCMDHAPIFEALQQAHLLIYRYHYTLYSCSAFLKSKLILVWQGFSSGLLRRVSPALFCLQKEQGRCLPSIAICQRLGWNEVLSERRLCAGPGQSWANIRRNCQCCFAVSGRGQVSFLNNRGLAVGLFAYIQVQLHSVLAVCVFEVTLDASLAGLLVGTPAASELGFLCI